MKFKVGYEVRVVKEAPGTSYVDSVGDILEIEAIWKKDTMPYQLTNSYWYSEDCLEPITDHDYLMDKILERNNKPKKLNTGDPWIDNLPESYFEMYEEEDAIRPQHYRKGEIDLYESAYRTRPFNEFRAIMEFVAERYMKRDKDNRIQDLDKAIYTLTRLKEYEEQNK